MARALCIPRAIEQGEGVSQSVSLLAALRAPGLDLPLPRTAVIVAHPDDESVGAGSRLPRLARARFVYVTDGSPADGMDAGALGLSRGAYAEMRQTELMRALALCGVPFEQVRRLGY